MIDQQTLKRAEQFQGRDDCRIHVEMKDGGVCEVLLAGTGEAVLYGLICTIQKLAAFAGSSFDDAIDAMLSLQKVVPGHEIRPEDQIKWGRKE